MPKTMARAIVMPNLKPPVLTTDDAAAYRDRILGYLPKDSDFIPLMTLYLTDMTSAEEVVKAKNSGFVYAVKLYPAGATTNSAAGVTDFDRVQPTLAKMAEIGLPLLIHGEVTDPSVDVFEREPVFLERTLKTLVARNPSLKIVLEHITTKEAVAFVLAAGPNVGATVTAHHLLYNRNALFEGGIRPHRYCLPVLKHESDRAALVQAVTSGSPKFFLGTDSAPHTQHSKECACGAAGMFTAHAALEIYATVFEAAGALEQLKPFACDNGPAFYGLPSNEVRLQGAGMSKVVLKKETWRIPESYTFGKSVVIPALAGEEIHWRAYVQ